MMELAQTMNQASEHLRAGRFADAETLLRQVLGQKPDHAQALHLLGCVNIHMRRPAEALDLIQRAIALDPAQAAFHSNLGVVLLMMGRKDDAIGAFRQSVKLSPQHPDTNSELGNLLCDVGQFDEAIDCFKRAAAARPGHAPSIFNLGAGWLRKALATPPDQDPRRKNDLREAIQCFQRTLSLRPDYADAANNLGNALQAMGKTDEAIAAWQRAVAIAPHPFAFLNLGRALCDKDRLDEALAAMQNSLRLKPDQPELCNNLGSLYRKTGRAAEAIASYDRAIALQPRHAAAHSSRLYSMYFHPGYDGPRILREHQRWNEQMAWPLERFAPHENPGAPGQRRRLRIGYVSPNFWQHSEAFFIVPLLANHDHREFEIYCYSDVRNPDALTTRLRSWADIWRSTAGMNDEQAANLIRRDKIDVLVDMTLHMTENRILVFARKPAPVQVTWLGYPGTTGLETMDYRLTDPYLDPVEESVSLYTEKSIRLADCWVCYDPLSDVPPAADRPAGPIQFASLNNPCKNNEPLLRLWARVMDAVPDSTILILASGEEHRNRLRGIFQSAGIAPLRIQFIDRTSRRDYLRLYDAIDICLDTLPYNGITTTCDALWMGVPVVTLTGKTACGRAGLSILSSVGLPELVARTEDEFVKIAGELAADRPRLAELRRALRRKIQQSPQMDAAGFARNVESAYRQMWLTWCK